nr:MAG: antirepressor protein KilAC domain [Bacteriophage sp.]
MDTGIQPFEFENNQVRAMVDGDEGMFVASDIARILGYRDAAALTRTLDDEEKDTRPIGTLGGTQQLSVISEPGLYKAILQRQTGRMEVEATKAFVKRPQRWVTHDVLPTIRKTGGYIPTAEADSDEDILAKASLIAQKTIDLKDQQIRAKDAQIKELEPKTQALDAFTGVEDRLLVRETAKVPLRLRPPRQRKTATRMDDGQRLGLQAQWIMARHRETLHSRTPRDGHAPKAQQQDGRHGNRFPTHRTNHKKGTGVDPQAVG